MIKFIPKIPVVLSAVLLLTNACHTQAPPDPALEYAKELDAKIPGWLNECVVPGAAIAIIDSGRIILQKGYGLADVKNKVRVTEQTGFNIASISKTVTAWGVMKLVEQGKLDLDSPAEKYLTRWHIPPSEFDVQGVTIRRLLSHTAGLSLHGYPGWSPSDTLPTIEQSLSGKTNGGGDVHLITEPGTKWQYSGGGYTVLQLIIEEVTGRNFADYMQTEVLDPLGMKNSSFKIDDRIMKASSLEHNAFGEVIPFELFTAQAAAGLHTTIEDFARFAIASIRAPIGDEKQTVLSPSSLDLMTTAAPAGEGRYGLGYSIETIMNTSTVVVGHGGSNDGWKATFKVDPLSGNGFVVITNGAFGDEFMDQAYCDWVLWKYKMPLGFRCRRSLGPILTRSFLKDGIDAALAAYHIEKNKDTLDYGFSEGEVNLFGYQLLWSGHTADAIKIFKMNKEEHPTSSNAYDSYGEGLLALGDTSQGVENYKLSIQLNPDNENGVRVLQGLGVSIDNLVITVPLEHLKLLAGEYQATDPPANKNGNWTIVIEEKKGMMFGNDGDYRYRLIPQGNDLFVNPDDGATLVFNAKNKNAVSFVIFEKYAFKKVK